MSPLELAANTRGRTARYSSTGRQMNRIDMAGFMEAECIGIGFVK